MRKHFLRATIGLGVAAIVVLLICDIYPDQVYASLDWGKEWVRILSSRSSYGFLAKGDGPKLRFDGDALAPPFMLRKSSAFPRRYIDAEGYRVIEAWMR